MTPERVTVNLGARGYDILVAPGLVAAAGRHIAPLLAQPRTAIVTDDTVAGLYLERLGTSLSEAGIEWTAIQVAPGESRKNFSTLESVLDRLLEARIERQDTVIALGGGVIGDLAGFAASILRRGVDVIQIPTTLLAQVDSSVGGKTGINARQGKNLIGTFHQPRLVLSDTGALDTLPPRELRAGYAEIVKYALIGDADFLTWLETNGEAVLAGDAAARTHAIVTSCRAKAAIVAADEREAGERALLNLGHTFAHALEAETGYDGSVLHGEAVAAGLVLAFELSARLGLCAPEDAQRIARHLRAVGLPAGPGDLGLGRTPATLHAHMAHDKKSRGGRVTFVLARAVGETFLCDTVEPAEVEAVLAAA